MNNVIGMPATTTFQPDHALLSAMDIGLKDVLIVGYDSSGDLVVLSSRMTRAEALWLLRLAEQHCVTAPDVS